MSDELRKDWLAIRGSPSSGYVAYTSRWGDFHTQLWYVTVLHDHTEMQGKTRRGFYRVKYEVCIFDTDPTGNGQVGDVRRCNYRLWLTNLQEPLVDGLDTCMTANWHPHDIRKPDLRTFLAVQGHVAAVAGHDGGLGRSASAPAATP